MTSPVPRDGLRKVQSSMAKSKKSAAQVPASAKKSAPKKSAAKSAAKTAAAPAKAVPAAAKAAPARPAATVEQIGARAHQIWIDAGKPQGKALDHWVQAERELSS